MIIDKHNYKEFQIGAKAGNLFELDAQGYRVPPFCCVNEESGYTREELEEYLNRNFEKDTLFSVRSSSSVEDGSTASFAGQFDTCLRVKREDVYSTVKKVLDLSANETYKDYCREQDKSLEEIRMTVMVQGMIEADVSGVLFTANPQGILNETVIVAGAGTGDGVVEDRTAVTSYYYNVTDGVYYYEQEEHAPTLPAEKIQELIKISVDIKSHFGMECDIEFAVKENTIYLLQARPITTLDKAASPIILDNSNIVESYPGITLPLTQSFIREVYYKVFRRLLIRLTRDEKSVEKMDENLRHMVDTANGRVYYRISNWYDVLLLLPFSSRIIPIWQEMMGVQNKTVSSGTKKVSLRAKVKTTGSFFRLWFTIPKKMEWLNQYFQEITARFEKMDVEHADTKTLLGYYKELENMVTEQWDLTLVNDMYAFLYTGLLKKKLKDRYSAEYISNISGIESLKPIESLTALAREAAKEGQTEQLKRLSDNEAVEAYLQKDMPLCRKIREYICLYGDRNLEELKLESQTFRTDPILLIKRILQYSENPPQSEEKKEALPALRGMTGAFAKRAAVGIANREKSRMNRSRLYGIMRLLMLRIGENLVREGKIETVRDVFWLFYEELEGDGEGLREIIEERKLRYKKYEMLPAYSRIIFAERVFDKNPVRMQEMEYERGEGSYTGVACSPGIVEGEVLIVDRPGGQMVTGNKILVTKMTDPGWVFLIADARGIIAEKGSLLSHTAIISRELKKTAVVGVPNITRLLKTGDIVRLDGNSGNITVLKKKEREK